MCSVKTIKDVFCIYPASKPKHNVFSSAQVIKNDFLTLRCLAIKTTKGNPNRVLLLEIFNPRTDNSLFEIPRCSFLKKGDNTIIEVVGAKEQGNVYY